MSLITDAQLESICKKEGFNVQCSESRKTRIGILSGNYDCTYCLTVIGFGIKMKWEGSSGNIRHEYLSGDIEVIKLTFGYIFVQ